MPLFFKLTSDTVCKSFHISEHIWKLMFRLQPIGWCRHPLIVYYDRTDRGSRSFSRTTQHRTNTNQFMETLWLVQRSIIIFWFQDIHATQALCYPCYWNLIRKLLINLYLNNGFAFFFVKLALRTSLVLWPSQLFFFLLFIFTFFNNITAL